MQPIGGWDQLGTALTGTARAVHTWVDNSANGRAALGTESKLYVLTPAGALADITPLSGFSAQDAGSTWSLDSTWLPGDAAAAPLTNAPSADAVTVTNEGIILALGADGNPRRISWCDRDDFTDWTAGFADLAGDLDVQAQGTIQCAKAIRAGTLIWTKEDLHILRFVSLPDVYGVDRVASDCGAISRGCVALKDEIMRTRFARFTIASLTRFGGFIRRMRQQRTVMRSCSIMLKGIGCFTRLTVIAG